MNWKINISKCSLLSHKLKHIFIVHAGIISTRELLDREKEGEYHLSIRAKDGGSRSCTMEVYITITDVNDNEPKFTMTQYVVSIPENAEVNTLLTRVAAVDYDLGEWDRKIQGLIQKFSYFACNSHKMHLNLSCLTNFGLTVWK